jgi:phage baseplate assembly protein W
MMSPGLIDRVSRIVHEDCLGADFDHKGVNLMLGKKMKWGKISIHDSTIGDILTTPAGTWAIYDAMGNHLATRDGELHNNLVQLDLLIREKELVDIMISKNGLTIELNERLDNVMININTVLGRLPSTEDLMEREFGCDYRRLYEVIMNGLKNVMVAIQTRRAVAENETRVYLVNRIRYMEEKFGEGSEQAEEQREKLFIFDDTGLKERANRFRDFLEKNNEKATKAFCKLSKEGGTNDDITQIKRDDGVVFQNSAQRGEHIRKFYENLYKKRLDALMSVEDFLGERMCNEEWVANRKLSGDERESLETAVTM